MQRILVRRARRRGGGKLAGLAVGVIMFLVVQAAPAWATSYSTDAYVVQNSVHCIHGHNFIANDQPGVGGRIDSRTQSRAWSKTTDVNNTDCNRSDQKPMPSGYIMVAQVLWKWNGGTAQWDVCNFGPSITNRSYSSSVSTAWIFDRVCGIGYYAMWSAHGVYNGGWGNSGWLPNKGVVTIGFIEYG